MNLTPHVPLLPAVCLSTLAAVEAAKYRGELIDADWPPLPYPGVTSYLLSIPAKTKPLPTLDVIPTPAVSTVTRKHAGAAGILVSFDGKSVQATDDGLAEAIAKVAPRIEWATINGYQGVRKIMAAEMRSTDLYYLFQLLPDRPGVLTAFKASDCVVVESELRRAS